MGIPATYGVSGSGLPVAGDQATAVLSGTIGAIGPTAPFAFRGPMNVELYASINTALTTTALSGAFSVASGTGLAVGASINSVNVPPGTTIKTLAGTTGTLAIPPISLSCDTDGVTNNLEVHSGVNQPATSTLLGATVTGPGIPAAGYTVTAILQSAVAPTNAGPGIQAIVQLSGIPANQTIPKRGRTQFSFARTANAITVTGADANAIFTGAGITYNATVQIERSFDGGFTWIVANIGGGGALAQYATGTPVSLTFGEPEKEVYYRLNAILYATGVINYRISQTGSVNETMSIPLIY